MTDHTRETITDFVTETYKASFSAHTSKGVLRQYKDAKLSLYLELMDSFDWIDNKAQALRKALNDLLSEKVAEAISDWRWAQERWNRLEAEIERLDPAESPLQGQIDKLEEALDNARETKYTLDDMPEITTREQAGLSKLIEKLEVQLATEQAKSTEVEQAEKGKNHAWGIETDAMYTICLFLPFLIQNGYFDGTETIVPTEHPYIVQEKSAA